MTSKGRSATAVAITQVRQRHRRSIPLGTFSPVSLLFGESSLTGVVRNALGGMAAADESVEVSGENLTDRAVQMVATIFATGPIKVLEVPPRPVI